MGIWEAPLLSDLDVEIAVFALNEAAAIEGCLRGIDRACGGQRAHITVVLNGTTDRSADVIRALRLENAAVSVWFIPAADKANAINRFFHDLRHEARTYCCVDAYVRIGTNALSTIAAALHADSVAIAASGVPLRGRHAAASRAAIVKGGVLGGQFFAVKPAFVERFVAMGLRLPVQLYRGDGLLGSMAAHDLDALGTTWNDQRIIGVADAEFEISPLSALRWRDIQRQYRREIRQARGRLENEAIKSIIYDPSCHPGGYAALPVSATDMIRDWMKSHTLKARSLRERYFLRQAIKGLDDARPGLADLTPRPL